MDLAYFAECVGIAAYYWFFGTQGDRVMAWIWRPIDRCLDA